MINLTELTTTQLNSIIAIKEQIETLQSQMDSIVSNGSPIPAIAAKRRRMSRAGRARIIAAVKARWARVKATKPVSMAKKRDRRRSPAVRAKLAAAAKARWAKAKAQGKTSL
jgi:hypothetical protein